MKNLGRTEVLGSHVANPNTSTTGHTIMIGWCNECNEPCKNAVGCIRCGDNQRITTKTYPLAAMEYRITAQFEQFVRNRAREAYMDVERVDPGEADKLRTKYINEYSAGCYNWDDSDSEVNYVRQALAKTWGAEHLMYLLMTRADPKTGASKQECVKVLNCMSQDDFVTAYKWALAAGGKLKLPTNLPPTNGSAEAKTAVPEIEVRDAKELQDRARRRTEKESLQPTFDQ